jgi:hypothetical protein
MSAIRYRQHARLNMPRHFSFVNREAQIMGYESLMSRR